MTTLELRGYLEELKAERSLALVSGLDGVDSYMADLESELESCLELYTLAAVGEIATLRGELFGPQVG